MCIYHIGVYTWAILCVQAYFLKCYVCNVKLLSLQGSMKGLLFLS